MVSFQYWSWKWKKIETKGIRQNVIIKVKLYKKLLFQIHKICLSYKRWYQQIIIFSEQFSWKFVKFCFCKIRISFFVFFHVLFSLLLLLLLIYCYYGFVFFSIEWKKSLLFFNQSYFSTQRFYITALPFTKKFKKKEKCQYLNGNFYFYC